MSKRRVVLYAVALAAAAAIVLALLDRTSLAIAALAVALVATFGWVVLWAQALNAHVGRVSAGLERQSRRSEARVQSQGNPDRERLAEIDTAVDALDVRLGSVQQQLTQRADGHDEWLKRVVRDLNSLRVLVQRTPSATAELDRVYRRLVHHDRPMPELGGWAMTSPTLVYALDQISSARVSTILECGSGSSTVWFALALEQRGGPGRIVALEASPVYADETRAKLAELGLTHRAQVLTAPLVDVELPGRDPQPWYDRSVLADELAGVDLLFVDGPPGDTAPQARYPALPVLADRLTDDSLVILDDSSRGSEQQVLALWTAGTHGGRRYEVASEVDRATVLRGVPVRSEVMHWADRSRGTPFSKDPSVVRFGERYLMYVSVPPKPGDRRWGQAVAASDDLSTWTTLGEIEREGEAEANGFCAGGAIVLGDRLHLFYQTYGQGADDAVCHASSTDGLTFDRTAGNPIIRPTGDWTCGRAIDAEAHVIGDEVFCYWATRDPALQVQMLGVHSASLTSDFSAEHWRQRCTESILKPELPWERNCIEAPTVCQRGDTYVMFYAGGYNNEPQQIGVAFSSDGLSWQRMSERPFLANGAPGEWNSSESGHPSIFVDPVDGSTWLFFQGNDDHGKSWYISKRRIEWDGHVPRLA